jgi:hypothetical protein
MTTALFRLQFLGVDYREATSGPVPAVINHAVKACFVHADPYTPRRVTEMRMPRPHTGVAIDMQLGALAEIPNLWRQTFLAFREEMISQLKERQWNVPPTLERMFDAGLSNLWHPQAIKELRAGYNPAIALGVALNFTINADISHASAMVDSQLYTIDPTGQKMGALAGFYSYVGFANQLAPAQWE